jgi:tetratricopeptide (TPR) repeat protein
LLSAGVYAQTGKDELIKIASGCQKASNWKCVFLSTADLIKSAPEFAGSYMLRGRANIETHKYDEAITDFKKGSSLDPTNALFPYGLGEIYAVKGDRPTAIGYFLQAAKLNSSFDRPAIVELISDRSKTDQDLRETFGNEVCRRAYNTEKIADRNGLSSLPVANIQQDLLDDLLSILPCKLNLNKQNKSGVTALHMASFLAKDATFVSELIKYGANPNAVDGEGQTPLMLAVSRATETPEIVKALLVGGASTVIKDKLNSTALDYSKQKGFAASTALIMNAANGGSPKTGTDLK